MSTMSSLALSGHRLSGLRGDIVRCTQYATTPSGKIRCVTMASGPGDPDEAAREDAGVTGKYRYKTGAAKTRGAKHKRLPGIEKYPRVYRSDDIARLRPGRNVPVPASRSVTFNKGKPNQKTVTFTPGAKGKGKKSRAVAGLAGTLPPSLKRMQFTKADAAQCRGLGRGDFPRCMARARDARIGR